MADQTHHVHPDVWRVHTLHQEARRLGRSLTTRAGLGECRAYLHAFGKYADARDAAEAVLGAERVALELARVEVTP